VFDFCEHDEDRVAALEDELEHLTRAFENRELPFPRTPESLDKFEANLAGLRARVQTARETLEKRRASNPLPAE
jgi:hypothetical protein